MTYRMVAVLGVLLMLAGTAAAQKAPASGTHITVSKNPMVGGMFRTIQEAVNAAAPGQVIEILDEEVYEEQVTIDGREDKVWAKNGHAVVPVGGKRGITIRYVPTAGAAVSARPVVKYRDTHNVSPRNRDEGQTDGDDIGSSGNFETNGVIRIIRTSDITIEGLIIDGGGIYPFWGDAAWGTANMAHGNSAVAVVISGDVQIRDCQLRNAVFGIAVKDRNVGGVYGNRNQADNDTASLVPLSGFGKTGNHLFEYNRILDNVVGIYFESSWDLGSSVRYNLFYRNYRRTGIAVAGLNAPASMAHSMDWVGGALKVKDNYLSPVAIYNNTLYDNERLMANHYQVGGQHLVFNNIVAGARQKPGSAHGIDGQLPFRMHHNTWSANDGIDVLSVSRTMQGCTPSRMDTAWIDRVQFAINGFPQLGALDLNPRSYSVTAECTIGGGTVTQTQTQTQTIQMTGPLPGEIISSATHFPRSSINRWLEMSGATTKDRYDNTTTIVLPNLFQSLTEAAPNFLEPDWTKPEVISFIRNKGWGGTGDAVTSPELATGVGILDWSGTGRADLGAIQYNGKRPCSSTKPLSRARIKPISVVTISGSGANRVARASFILSEDIASSLNAPAIKYIRFIEVPINSGEATAIITQGMIHTVPVPAGISLSQGSNTISFQLPSTVPDIVEYGFFELVIEGVDGIGRKIVTDVGFLPYRQLDQYLDIQVVDAAGTIIPNPTVAVGDPVNIKLTAMDMSGTAYSGAGPLVAEYRLLSGSAARMWREVEPEPADPLVRDSIVKVGASITKTYTVYFTSAGKEIVLAAGAAPGATASAPPVAFMGALGITVTPQPPARVAFRSPISKSMLVPGVPPTGMTGYYAVEVEVQDKFGNPAGAGSEISLVSLNPAVASVLPPTVVTDAGGVARFVAQASATAKAGDVFDMVAYAVIGSDVMLDTASLRIDDGVITVVPPKVVSASYVFAGGMISQMRVTLDRVAEAGWFSGAEAVLSGSSVPFSDAACLSLDAADANVLVLDYTCAFGAIIPESLASTSGAVIYFDRALEWQPLTIAAGGVAVLESERVVPRVDPDVSAVVVIPTNSVGFELTVGPNPVGRDDGMVKIFVGATVPGRPPLGIGSITGKLTIYDAVGNAVRKIKIGDVPVGADPRVRPVGEWDLRDSKNRPVSTGTYLARGVVTVNGKREKVSIVIGVR